MIMPYAGKLLLGVDAGTTLMKAAVYAADGSCLGSGEAPQGAMCPRPGWSEQNPADWWTGLCDATRQAVSAAGMSGEEIAAIGLSTQGGTIGVFAPDGTPRGPALVWNDARHRAAAPQDPGVLDEHFGHTGAPNRNGTPVALEWLIEHRREWFIPPYRIGYVPDYLTFRLTGEWVSDPTNLSISNICHLADGDVSPAVIGRLGVPRDAFAATRPAGEAAGALLPAAAQELGLGPGTLVATPGHDQYVAALGAGCVREGDSLLSAGTAWVLVLVTGRPVTDRASSFWPGRHVEPGKWGLLGAISCGNATLDCLLAMTRQGADWDCINAAVSTVPAGSEGLLIIPHLVGRTLPTSDTTARGAIVGWSLGHGREHFWRAAMEAPCLEARRACAYLAARGIEVSSLRMVGGSARSPIWPKIVASVLGVPVCACPAENAAVRGAACLAARALGHADLPQIRDWQEFPPIPEWQKAYDAAYDRYTLTIERLETRQ